MHTINKAYIKSLLINIAVFLETNCGEFQNFVYVSTSHEFLFLRFHNLTSTINFKNLSKLLRLRRNSRVTVLNQHFMTLFNLYELA